MVAPLLPAGLHDLLPPDAAKRFAALQGFIAQCQGFGYHFIAPPLMEFADTPQALVGATPPPRFQLMDGLSQRMVCIRGDITPQIARIASTRLAHWPRPLRLCYAGAILRPYHTQWRPEREFFQVGLELIGVDAPHGEIEMMRVAIMALHALGLDGITLDISYPSLLQTLARHYGITGEVFTTLQQRLQKKDSDALQLLPDHAKPAFALLLECTTPAMLTTALKNDTLPLILREAAQLMVDLSAALSPLLPNVTIHFDLTEQQGFHFQHGVCFGLFARHIKGEIGRGGRYTIASMPAESAIGFSLYLDTLLRALPAPVAKPALYVMIDTSADTLASLHKQDYTLHFHNDSTTLEATAHAHNASYFCPNQQKVILAHA